MGAANTTDADTPESTRGFACRSWHLVAVGALLGAVAFWERWEASRSGRRYVLCHHSARLDHLTLTALGLIGSALIVSVACAVAADSRGAVASRRLAAGCFVAVLALVVAADTVDAAGERLAGRLSAAEPFEAAVCDYTPQDYAATPGWFTW
ncbi:hypothetical protein [Streptomyces sp. NBC_00083]|uniref:hypothetical protein n=1 Tax=Streptomyces sp. NBC_00083 TaxID=2975647 RepID=UPI0022503298|nr:hypothetical protein [Streptomyces sp. NBC_00083]MCX5384345.1 hypothetical protein [Streptomyces sp. NBC_00083]